jgi:PAS domain S-box-containing protein
MGRPTGAGRDERVLVLMPTEKDAARTLAALGAGGLAGVACKTLPGLCAEIAAGAGTVLLTEELIARDRAGCLAGALREQPPWSSLPVVVLAREGGGVGGRPELLPAVAANVTLIERPVRLRTLLSVVRAALRTRRHQYDIRDALAERERQAVALRESEQQLALIYNNTSDCLYLVRVEPGDRYRFLSVNETFLRVSGYAADQVVGRVMEEVVPPANHGLVRAKYQEVIDTRRPLVYVEAADLPAGRRYGEITLTPIPGPGRPVTHLLASIKDVTDQKLAEEKLRESEERAAFVRRSSGVGFWYCDLPFDVLEWDDLVKAHFHLPPDARVTMDTFYARLHPDDRGPTRRAIERSIADRAPYDVDYRTVDPTTGAIKWVRAIGRTAYAADGTPIRFDGVTVDVTDRKEAEERVRQAETEFRAVFEGALDAILVADDDGRYVAVNPAAGELFGVPPARILGRRVADFLEPGFDFATAWREFLDHRHERGMIRLVRADGAVREAEYSATREVRPGQHLSVVRDVTDRKRAEAELKKQSERLRLLWESASILLTTDEPDAMMRGLFAKLAPHFGLDTYFNFMVDEAGNALQLESCLGIPEETARAIRRLEFGQAICGNVALHRRPIAATFIQQSDDPKVQLVRGFGIRAYACNPLLAGDRLLGTLSFASRTRDQFDPDELEFLRTVCQYVTVAYERLRLVRELRQADRRKDEFLALLAHELRNPLAPLRNGLQVMRLAAGNPDTVARTQAMMDRQLAHMVRLIDDLLDVSRISRNKMQLRKARVTLADVVSSAVETARPLVEAARHELTVTLPPDPVVLDADPVRLAQVFANLLTNSAKYTETGGKIWLEGDRRDGEVVVSVRDTGIGIPADALPTIFDMFSQVDRSLERATGGLGIGLALVRGLVEMHGGSVTAASDGPDRGSTFTVRLPVLPNADVRSPVDRVRPEIANHQSPIDNRKRVLVVDDNRDSATSMAQMLRLLGHEVATAHDGVEAVDAAEGFRPDVVLMDVGMPRLNGHEATRRIRERPWGHGVVVLALTGWGQDADRARSREAGCDGHLVKPVSLPDLERVLGGLPNGTGA